MTIQPASACREVSMLDLGAEHDRYREALRAAAWRVLESNQFIGGPDIAQLEVELAERVGVKHCVAVSNGTDALLAALMALDIGAGDEVIVPALSFFATAGGVARVGATPVFVDIDPRTFNLDPECVRAAVTERTKAIIAVHLFGQCADMDAINAVARERGIRVIEDAAQALGASYHGRPAGSLGDIATVSFYPTKNLGGCGEGGAVFTNDSTLGPIVRQVRQHGESERYVHERVGGNFRLDSMKAAMLLVKLAHFDECTSKRRDNARLYDELLSDVAVQTPVIAVGQDPVYHQYSILCDRRDELMSFLRDRGVGSAVFYPVALHLQPCFAALGYRTGSLPVTEETCSRIMSIPCHPMLDRMDVEYVAGCVREFYKS